MIIQECPADDSLEKNSMVIKMRIAIFTEVMSPFVSGISSYVDVLKKGLTNLGHEVLIVSSTLHTEETIEKKDIILCPAKRAKNKYGYECTNINDKITAEALRKFRPDVIHIQTDTRIGYMGLQIADRLHRPVVFSIHDFFHDRFAFEKSKLVWKVKTYIEKQHFCDMIDNAQVVISSNKRASTFVRSAGRKRRVTLIPIAADQSRFDYRKSTPESRAKMCRRLGLPKNAVTAVFAGDLSIEKNIEFVLTAFAKYIKPKDNIHFLVVGDGTELNYLKSLADTLRIGNMVHFTGVVSHSIMPEIYAACDAYVCSFDDGLMSMSFVEAMSCGLPVLVKEDKEKYVHNMIRIGVNGFTYRDGREFTDYLKKIAGFTPFKKEKMRSIIRSSMKSTDAETMAAATVNAYETAIKIYKLNKNYR